MNVAFAVRNEETGVMKKLLGLFGDYHHACSVYERPLKKALEADEVDLHFESYPTSFDPHALADLDVLVLCKEAAVPGSDPFERWMSPQGEEAIGDWVQKGGRLFGWHSGLASYDPEGPIHKMYRGHFRGHPPEHTFEVKVTNHEHPYAAGIEDFTLHSEELYNFPMNQDSNVWLTGVSPENGEQPVAWEHAEGEGHVACFTLAHYRANNLLPVIQTILRRCCLGV